MNHNNFPKGATWHKWDIHTHTPLDHEWDGKPNNLGREEVKKQFAKDYVNYASEQGLSAIAITDHNFCNQVDDLLIPYIKEEASKKAITILPGFEITATDGSGVHILAIFHEDTDLNKIHVAVKRLFKPDEALMPQNGIVPISEKSVQEIYSDLKQNPSNFDFLLVFAHIDRDNGVLNGKTITGIRRAQEWLNPNVNISQISSIKSLEPNSFIGGARIDKKHFYHRQMTYIVASDCRGIGKKQLDSGRYNLGEKFTWIKSEPTFNGLKQIVHEPNSRVRIQSLQPERKLSSNIIEKVRFVNDRSTPRTFDDEWIYLNQNLNTIIGGKSSGKSLLLTLISKTIDPEVEAEWYDELLGQTDFEVVWGDGVVYKLRDGKSYYDKDGSEFQKRRPISHIPQLAIHKLIEERPDEYRSIILNFLKEEESFKVYYEKFEKNKDDQIELISNEIAEIFKNKSLHERKLKELKELGDINAKSNELVTIKKELSELENKKLSPKELKEFENVNKKFSEISLKLKSKKEVKKVLDEYKSVVNRSTQRFKDTLLEKQSDLTSTVKATTQTEILKVRDKINKALESFEAEVESVFAEHISLKSKIKSLKAELDIVKTQVNFFSEKTGNQKDIDQLNLKVKSLSDGIEEINKYSIIVDRIKNKIELSVGEIIKTFKALTQIHINFSREIDDKYSDLIPEDNLTLSLNIDFDIDKFFIDFFDLFDRRFNLVDLAIDFDRNTYRFNLSSHSKVVETVLSNLLSQENELRFKRKNEVEKAVRAITANYYILQFKLKQNQEEIEDMSYGKKSLILLKLYLSLNRNENPIFIDQPEDNLDNRTIYSELKEFIKEKKTQRQIIIVTHNANLVVATDAESVIVANQDGQNNKSNNDFRFEYISGALENSFVDESRYGILYQMGIKEHVCDILEGGKDAFRERELKYGF